MDYKEKVIALLNSQELSKEQKEKLENIFPELQENKDDRIVRCLLNYFNHVRYNGLDLKGTDVDEVIVWLEKQSKRLGADEVTKHQWISVEDELPEVCVAVLTTTPHGTQRVGFYEDGWWLANTPDLVRMGSITHWMPMPPPPHHIIDANKKVDRVIGTADHIKTALDVLNKKGGEK